MTSKTTTESTQVTPQLRTVGVRMSLGEFAPQKQVFTRVTANQSIKVTVNKSGNHVEGHLCLIVKTTNAEDINQDTGFRIHAHYVVVLDGATGIADEDIKRHALRVAWPYWSEFVQTSSSRMGLPPIHVPLLTDQEIANMNL